MRAPVDGGACCLYGTSVNRRARRKTVDRVGSRVIPIDDQDQSNNQDVDSGSNVNGLPDSEPGEKDEGGTESADNSSQSIHAVEDAHSPAQPLESLDEEPGDDWQGSAHQKAGGKQDQERQGQSGQTREKRRDGEITIETNVDGWHCRDDDRRQDGEYRDASLQTGVKSERAFAPIGETTEVETAGRHSTEKGGHDGGRGVGGVSEHQDEHPLPDNLIDQSGSARKKEQYQQEKLSTA